MSSYRRFPIVKERGESVQLNEALFVVSLPAVDAEIPAPAAGVLGELGARPGDLIAVGETIGFLEVLRTSNRHSATRPGNARGQHAPMVSSSVAFRLCWLFFLGLACLSLVPTAKSQPATVNALLLTALGIGYFVVVGNAQDWWPRIKSTVMGEVERSDLLWLDQALTNVASVVRSLLLGDEGAVGVVVSRGNPRTLLKYLGWPVGSVDCDRVCARAR